MIFYLTYNDSPSGIYSSQVIDVIKFFNSELNTKTKLISFISIRGFFSNRKKIILQLPEAIVLPMFPKMKNWRKNNFLLGILCFIYNPKTIIARSVLATNLALQFKSANVKIVYDGRGAISAEWEEYKVVNDIELLSQIKELEGKAIIESDYRISVSEKLVDYWKQEFKYFEQNHVVIPCTINKHFEDISISKEQRALIRSEFNFKDDDVIFVYSGSVAGWQSFDLLAKFIKPLLNQSSSNKILFLSDNDKNIDALKKQFPQHVHNKHVKVLEVPNYLASCNFGLLIREQSITNKVASPVKFGEYLACGLPVIISENLGDYSQFVVENKCGFVFNKFSNEIINKTNLIELVNNYFTKAVFINSYKRLLQL